METVLGSVDMCVVITGCDRVFPHMALTVTSPSASCQPSDQPGLIISGITLREIKCYTGFVYRNKACLYQLTRKEGGTMPFKEGFCVV